MCLDPLFSGFVFVYGTLKSNYHNEVSRYLHQEAQWVGNGFVFGHLYDIGQYPGLITSGYNQMKVYGEIYTGLNEPLIKALDEYEGYSKTDRRSEYIRSDINVYAHDKCFKCMTYLYNWSVSGLALINTGNY